MKTAKKPKARPESIPCFDCEAGSLQPVLLDHSTNHPRLGRITIPAVPMLRCDRCGATVIGEDGNTHIDTFLDKALHAISPQEIQAFLDKYKLTQKRAAEITGYGEKNISRWLGGRARPSESVSNFLRVLLAEESAFARLLMKNFPETTKAAFPAEERQPDEDEKQILKLVDYPALVRIGAVVPGASPMVRRTELCRLLKMPDLVAFRDAASGKHRAMAAFKDTNQQSNLVSGAIWIELGLRAAEKLEVKPYDRGNLQKAVSQLRELTQSPLAGIIPEVRRILAGAGVALVFAPSMKQSAFRGCTQLLTPTKAVIIHSLKYRTVSQFWLILFHEIAHLVLHITNPGDVFEDYDDQSTDPREAAADDWARDTLVFSDALIAFQARNDKPEPWQIQKFAQEVKVHPAIAAEVFNKKAGWEVIKYSYLKMKGLFPHISEAEAEELWKRNELAV
ncbi:MAG: type II toxin-antitoxin system MqsA family antitoxin [Verrucomicrobia bacterium]|nr:type II toxin-antitoxin system MqsA family antitoxin [Verrucomicrobiota bacterium]